MHSSQFLVELGGLKCRYGLSGREVTPPAIDVMLVQQVFYYSRQDTCRVRELSAGRMRESCTVGPPEPQNDSLVELLLPQELQGGPGLNLVQF